MEWLSHSQKKYCELCKTSFRFTKLYDHSMPATLPLPLFFRQLARHGLKGVSRWVRYLLVGFLWICCLPWCIRQIWRGLFWLADGNWLDEGLSDVQVAAEAVSVSDDTATPSVAELSQRPNINFTIPEYLERIKLVFPPMQISLADIVRVFFSHGVIGRLLQLVLSVFIPSLRHYENSNNSYNSTVDLPASARRPSSLLSDVKILATWSKSPLINHATVDIVEGQLICVLLVAAFILVFLIREWVINQQPILNMPDPDLAQFIPDRPAEDGGQAHLGHQLQGAEPNPEGEGAIIERGRRPIAIPRAPRRALTDDNILLGTGNLAERPNLPVRSQSLLSHHDDSQDSDGAEEATGESSAVADDFESRPARRHSLSNSILVHREVEISRGTDDIGIETRDQFPAFFHNDYNEVEMADVFDSAQLDEIDSQAIDRSTAIPVTTFPRRVSFAEIPDIIDPEGHIPAEFDIGQLTSDSDSVIIHTPDSGNADFSIPPVDAVQVGEGGESFGASVGRPVPEPVEEASLLGRISKWLWHTDTPNNDHGRPATELGPQMEARDDEHIVDDVLAEAPFVPNLQREAPDAPPALEAPLDDPPEAREPNVVFGVDLNDPNAADDAEDLDGVLELLGMEGPIFGMIQNVIFSLFLITVTLSASVWCPYIWGKIALLFLSNPTGMLVKAPIFVLSQSADIVVDIIFFVVGLAGFLLSQPAKLLKAAITPAFPSINTLLDTMTLEGITLDLSQKSGSRLERTLTGAILSLKPDLPTFSMQSHHALIVFKTSLRNAAQWASSSLVQVQTSLATNPLTARTVILSMSSAIQSVPQLLGRISQITGSVLDFIRSLPADLNSPPSASVEDMDPSLVEWSTEDRILTIILGYAFFAVAGIVFLELAHILLGLRDDEKVEGYFADSLRQAGGVMKVIVIIGIEMLVFPLYCGLLLDIALLPLFANATLASRIGFMIRTPFTGIFIHWFIGTCYMFHFALFVSICRKIMRKGVLYFIRDPDDPTFHPVRDVLERPVPAQLGKIAFSALVYGALVIICLGGVVWSIDWVGGVLPIQWATAEPRLAFPVDIIFYNFLLPFVLRKAEPSKKISAMYQWWFQGCAKVLRLTNFLFGEERKEETYSRPGTYPWNLFTRPDTTNELRVDGSYARAPASDSVRISKGRNVFLEVTEQNERVDGQTDVDFGMHGKKDPQFTKVYLPPNFRARIATFIFLLWVFAASTGVAFTIGPLLVGRKVTQLLSQSTLPPNDLYALTVGIHIFAVVGYLIAYARRARDYLGQKTQWVGTHLLGSTLHVFGVGYLGIFTVFVLPFVLAMITELYIHIPLFTYLQLGQEKLADATLTQQPVATIFVLQSWTIGLLYLRLLLRLFTHHVAPDSQVATALRAITRDGYLNPDVRLASRAFVLPVTVLCVVLLAFPLGYAKATILLLGVQDQESQMRLYRLAYPSFLGLILTYAAILALQRQLATWRVKIRDEVYLIGERLHNFQEPTLDKRLGERWKGKEKAL